jgi:hypothetical protein
VTENMVPRHRDGFYPTTRALTARRVQWKTQTNNINWRGELKLVLENYNYCKCFWICDELITESWSRFTHIWTWLHDPYISFIIIKELL